MERLNARVWILGAGFVSMALACGKSTPQSSDTKIIGGESVDNGQADARRWSTVALTTDHKKSESQESPLDKARSFCTGTLIAPRVVVTAAHCIQAIDKDTGLAANHMVLDSDKDFIISFDTTVSRDGKWVRAKKVLFHPDWDPKATLTSSPTKAPNDIGLVFLEESAPSSMRPAQIADLGTTPSEGDSVYLAGYGVTESRQDNDGGTLRQVVTKFKKADTKARRLVVGAMGHGACAGDSGGPLYLKVGDDYQLAGATSTGAEFLGYCMGSGNNYTDVRYYKDWINGEISALGNL